MRNPKKKSANWYRQQSLRYAMGEFSETPAQQAPAPSPRQTSGKAWRPPKWSRILRDVTAYMRFCGLDTPGGDSRIAMAQKILALSDSSERVDSKEEARRVIARFYETLPGSLQHNKTIKRLPGFYDSTEWRQVRYEALKRSRGVCELCGAAPAPGHPLHVDHIKPRSLFPALELDVDNLQVLCDGCNLGKGNRDCIDWRRG